MTPEEFIDNVLVSIDTMMEQYSQGKCGPTFVGAELDKLGLPDDQREKVLGLIRLAVGEATHSIICGIEGSSSLGKCQQIYQLLDEHGNKLTGDLGVLLYEKLEE